MTPHNKAKKDEIAPVAIMPGDPLRAQWIAKNNLEDARLVNDVRGIFAYTGAHNGKLFTVMAHGMGIPSIGIYTWELFKFYEVKTIIRVGSAGSYSKQIKVGDVIIAKDAASFSPYASDIGVPAPEGILAATPLLVERACQNAERLGISAHCCRVFSSDSFYNKYSVEENIKRSHGAEAVEMEAFGLYANAQALGKNALTLLTCSDSLVTGESMSAEARQTSFSGMVKLAFEIGGI
ncbi:MAG: purine-nucleoside phosphorylase [Termitinemataceae bacterium]|nr:MAG: purine-nucleoside phosphorylase [Termitinemataceae bacterium]